MGIPASSACSSCDGAQPISTFAASLPRLDHGGASRPRGSTVDTIEDFQSFDYLGNVESPPAWLAWLGVLFAGAGILMAAFSRDLGYVGYFASLLAVITGIVYRTWVRSKQKTAMFLPNIQTDRISVIGVIVGFVGIVWNAYNAAQLVAT